MFEPVHKLLEKTTLLRKTNITIPFNSLFKSNLVIFKKKSPKTPFPRLLLLNSLPIPFTDIVKFVGLIFHNRHSWLPHIETIKAKFLGALNVLKYLSGIPLDATAKSLSPNIMGTMAPLFTVLLHHLTSPFSTPSKMLLSVSVQARSTPVPL